MSSSQPCAVVRFNVLADDKTAGAITQALILLQYSAVQYSLTVLKRRAYK